LRAKSFTAAFVGVYQALQERNGRSFVIVEEIKIAVAIHNSIAPSGPKRHAMIAPNLQF
jgi:hypothetical protein